MPFAPAVKEQSKLRLALYGPPGGGKTLTSQMLALALAGGDPSKFGVIDSEHGSANKYADKVGQFQHSILTRYGVDDWANEIKEALDANLLALVLDSFSHAWEGEGGILDLQTALTEQNRGDSMTGWNKVKPHEKRLWNVVLSANTHLIVTMRSKNTWVEGTNERGRKTREIVGLEPIQRKGSEYEFDVVCFMQPDEDSDKSGVKLKVEKTRYDQLPRGGEFLFSVANPESFEDFTQRVLASVKAGDPPKAATKSEIKTLTELLVAEGYEEKRVNDVLGAEQAQWGVIPQRFVQDQITKAMNRAERKRQETPTPEEQAA